MNKPESEISCVIPSYENLDLLARCLMSVLTQENIIIEVIVCDDSHSQKIRKFVNCLSKKYSNIIYLKGPRSSNPVDNWNKGLAVASCKYCVVIHHDEYFLDKTFLRDAINAIKKDNLIAAIGKSAVIGVNRRSNFNLVRKSISLLGNPLWLIFMVNWIGPTGSFVFKNRSDIKFNNKLKYLPDVDFYFRILSSNNYILIDKLSVISIGHHSSQITSTYDYLTKNITEVQMVSKAYGKNISKTQSFVLNLFSKLRKYSSTLITKFRS
jgi:glycosyltransferase involved in cell wall biosynthesis